VGLEAFLGLGLSGSSPDFGTRNLVLEMYGLYLVEEKTFSITYPRLAGEVEEESLVLGIQAKG
jgi:hypothetical protein